MKHTRLPRIQLDEKHLPYHWEQKLISNQEIGGVFLVFLSGKTKQEITLKVKLLKNYAKTLKVQLKDFAKVTPVDSTSKEKL